MHKKYFFLHIPKTAGISVFKTFESILGYNNVFHANLQKKHIISPSADTLLDYTLIAGHNTIEEYKQFFGDRYSIVFLRHPIERFLSHYYYAKYNSLAGDEDSDPFIKDVRSFDLKSYIGLRKNENKLRVWNRQTFYLTGCEEYNLPKDQLLGLARENLTSVNFVGIYELLYDSLKLLCKDCNWPPVKKIPLYNTTRNRPGLKDLDKKIINTLMELCDLDMELYRYGLYLFMKKSEVY